MMLDLYEACRLLPAGRDTTRNEILKVFSFLRAGCSGSAISRIFEEQQFFTLRAFIPNFLTWARTPRNQFYLAVVNTQLGDGPGSHWFLVNPPPPNYNHR